MSEFQRFGEDGVSRVKRYVTIDWVSARNVTWRDTWGWVGQNGDFRRYVLILPLDDKSG